MSRCDRLVVMTLHKSASMLLRLALQRLSALTMTPHYFEGDANLPKHWDLQQDPSPILRQAGLFGPIYTYCPIADAENTQIILQVRDPRDLMVSLYYSFAYSHPDPKDTDTAEDRRRWREMGIDQFVLHDEIVWGPPGYRRSFKCTAMANRFLAYGANLLGRSNVTVLHYEDMFQDFDAWWTGFSTAAERVVPREALDVFLPELRAELTPPGSENHFTHKRRMLPGDHVSKLAPETIRQLDIVFSDAIKIFGYERTKAPQ